MNMIRLPFWYSCVGKVYFNHDTHMIHYDAIIAMLNWFDVHVWFELTVHEHDPDN